MADSSQIRENIAAFMQEKASTRLINTLFDEMPTLEFFFALNGGKSSVEGLGRPKSRVLVSGMDVTKARQEKLFAEREYRPMIQKSSLGYADVKVMGDYDSDPTVASWESNSILKTFVQPRFKFTRLKAPYKVAHSDVRTVKPGKGSTQAQAAEAIGSVYDATVKTKMGDMLTLWNGMLWGTAAPTGSTAGYPSNEDADTWDNIHSIANALSASNTYGGVDRSLAANAWWRGNTDATARAAVFDDLINYCNYDLAMAKKGLGVKLIVTGPTLFKKAKAEALAAGPQSISNAGIQEFPEFGFKREVVRIGSGGRPVYVICDFAVPASCAAFLDPSTWTFAIAPEGNFKISTPADQTKVEGGDEADTGTINSELMLVCEVPSANAYFNNLT